MMPSLLFFLFAVVLVLCESSCSLPLLKERLLSSLFFFFLTSFLSLLISKFLHSNLYRFNLKILHNKLVLSSADNVARSLSIVFNVVFTFFLLGKATSFLTCLTLLVVIFGFIVGIDGEVNFSLIGTVAGVLSSVFVSLNSIYTAKILTKVDNDKSLLLYYNNLNASVLFLPLIVLFETEIIVENTAKLFSLVFWSCMTLTGCMGFAIGLVTVMQVKATSPLTHNISGTAKAAVQVL